MNYIKKILKYFWKSPTFTTWGSFITSTINWVIVFPLILKYFSTDEIALWLLFKIFIDIKNIADFGFSSSFSRIIAYTTGKREDIYPEQNNLYSTKNIKRVIDTINYVYNRIALVSFIFLLLSSFVVKKTIEQTNSVQEGWLAWISLLFILPISMLGNKYSTILEGANLIAVYRRSSILIQILSITSGLLILVTNPNLLNLVFCSQIWLIFGTIFYRHLVYKNFKYFNIKESKPIKDNEIFQNIWPRAWRSAIGIMMSYGLTQGSALIYAQIGSTQNIATYLLSLRLAQTINSFSQAPFYSKLPQLNSLYSQNRIKDEVKLAQKGMTISLITFSSCFIIIGYIGIPLFTRINSSVSFSSPILWLLLSLAFYFERFGAMHLQLFSTTNNIVWHYANGFSGAGFIFLSIILFSKLNYYAFPLALFISNFLIYSIYSAFHSYKFFNLKFSNFEFKTSIIPFLTMVSLLTLRIFLKI